MPPTTARSPRRRGRPPSSIASPASVAAASPKVAKRNALAAVGAAPVRDLPAGHGTSTSGKAGGGVVVATASAADALFGSAAGGRGASVSEHPVQVERLRPTRACAASSIAAARKDKRKSLEDEAVSFEETVVQGSGSADEGVVNSSPHSSHASLAAHISPSSSSASVEPNSEPLTGGEAEEQREEAAAMADGADEVIIPATQNGKASQAPGALLWVKQGGYPWWPALLTKDVERKHFSRVTGSNRLDLHVHFFGPGSQHAWVPARSCVFWADQDACAPPLPHEVTKRWRPKFEKAFADARECEPLTPEARVLFLVPPVESSEDEEEEDEDEEEEEEQEEEEGKEGEAAIPRPARRRSAYTFFTADFLSSPAGSKRGDNASKFAVMAQLWSTKSEKERAPYVEKQEEDKERYARERKVYRVAVREARKAEAEKARKREALDVVVMDMFKKDIASDSTVDVDKQAAGLWEALGKEEKKKYEMHAEGHLAVLQSLEPAASSASGTAQQLFFLERLKAYTCRGDAVTVQELLTQAWDTLDAPSRHAYEQQEQERRQAGRRRNADASASRYGDLCRVCKKPGELICCEGGCYSSFHVECLGLPAAPTHTFVCTACVAGEAICACCEKQDAGLIKCAEKDCPRSYHRACVERHPFTRIEHVTSEQITLSCPAHTCGNCDNGISTASPMLHCACCPVAYHKACLPAGCEEVFGSSIVCPRHAPSDPALTKHYSINCCLLCGDGGALMCCDRCPAAFHQECIKDLRNSDSGQEGQQWECHECVCGSKAQPGAVVWAKLGPSRWWPGRILPVGELPDCLQRREHEPHAFPVYFFGSHDYAWLSHARVVLWIKGDEKGKFSHGQKRPAFSRGLEEALPAFEAASAERAKVVDTIRAKLREVKVHAVFKRIRNNDYLIPRPPRQPVPECACDPQRGDACGEDCLNRMMMIECSPKSCPIDKELCQNRRFQQHKSPKLVPFKTDLKGMGLRAGEAIAKGSFVIEYVGEVLSVADLHHRIEEQRTYGITSFYFMSLDGETFLDARLKSNMARFINHSCSPNCITQKWNVLGETRVGIFAKRDITEGEELTFDYQFDCLGSEQRDRCHCGAPNCAGIFGGKGENPDASSAMVQRRAAKKARMAAREPERCMLCGDTGTELLKCVAKDCRYQYHASCLGVPHKSRLVCPAHDCCECHRNTTIACSLCPVGFCSPMHALPSPAMGSGGFVCDAHPSGKREEGDLARIMARLAMRLQAYTHGSPDSGHSEESIPMEESPDSSLFAGREGTVL